MDDGPGKIRGRGRGRSRGRRSGDRVLRMSAPWRALRPMERAAIGVFVLVAISFGAIVVYRSALLTFRRTDFGVYARAAWGVRAGENIYSLADDRGWHYCYPPLLAILLTPLADPPATVSRAGMLPFWVSVAIWYSASVGALFLSLHWLASAIEERFPTPTCLSDEQRARRWWLLRFWPVLLCLPTIGFTLSRGQVGLILVGCLTISAACLVRRQSVGAGVLLGLAASLKFIPIFLALYPLRRRDGRMLLGVAMGMIAGLAMLPALVFGPGKALALSEQFVSQVLAPGLGVGRDATMARELTSITATHSQAMVSVAHRLLHFIEGTTPAPSANVATRMIHWLVAGMVTLCVLMGSAARRRGPAEDGVFLGSLAILMVWISPVCHVHYLIIAAPLVAVILALGSEDGEMPWRNPWVIAPLFGYVIATAVVMLPGMERWLDLGVAGFATVFLLVPAHRLLNHQASPAEQSPASLPRAA